MRVVVTTKLCYHTCRHPKSNSNAQSLRQVLEQVVVATKLCYHVPIRCQAANGLADQHGDQHVCGNVSDVRGVTTTRRKLDTGIWPVNAFPVLSSCRCWSISCVAVSASC